MKRVVRGALALALLGALLGSAPAESQAPADTPRPVLEMFVHEGCPYCNQAREWLPTLRRAVPNVRVIVHDVVRDSAALARLQRLAAGHPGPLGVPAFLVRDRLIIGWSGAEVTGRQIERALTGGADTVQDSIIAPGETVAIPPSTAVESRLFGRLDPSTLGLPAFTIALGLIDGFNPCAMWVLVFVLSILVGMNDRRRVVLIGGTFLLVSGLVYFAFMAAWLNIFRLIGMTRAVQVTLGIFALLAATVNLKDFFAFGHGPSIGIPAAAKPGIYAQVRRVIAAEHLGAALGAAAVLALLVNTVELLCTSGLPAIYTQLLATRSLDPWQYYGYLALYNAAYIFDDAILLTVAIVTLRRSRLQEGGARVLKLVSGLVMLVLALLLLFRPEWLAQIG
jgi:hypothetical protein